MEKKLSEILPIMAVEHDCILSKKGDITVAFSVELPEIFTLSGEEYETLHQAWIKAIRVLPKHSVLHKQDWYLETRYKAQPETAALSFLDKMSGRHFNGRRFLDHSCYVFLTKKASGRKAANSMFSSLIRGSIVPPETLSPSFLQDFVDSCGQFSHILESSGLVRMRRLKESDILSAQRKAGLIEQYCCLGENKEELGIREMAFSPDLQVGDRHCMLFSLGDAEDLPHLCGSRINYEKYSTDRTKFSIGFASALGLLLPTNHIYNQYVFIGDGQQTINDLEKKKLRLQSLSAYSRENAISMEATDDFLNEAIGEQRLPVRAHFNVLVWTQEREKLKELKNQVSAALAQMDAIAKQEIVGAPQIFWAGIPGNAADFPQNDTFLTFAEQASCFFVSETNYRSDPPQTGIRFCDRISNKPVFWDLFDSPRARGTTSNMGVLCCGTSGGGKSLTICHLARTLYDQGAHCVTIDIGGSYKGLCDILNGYYFTYTIKDPIRFNPFYLPEGVGLDTEKRESLKSLLVALWKQENENFNRSEYVALSNALQGYYHKLSQDKGLFPCFNTFYEYLREEYREVLRAHQVKDKDFDVDNFLYVLHPYYKGGEFDFLLNATENLELLSQRFLVVEMDEIKGHPVLFGVVVLILTELFVSKMRKLKGIRKVLIIDEAWKAISKSGMAEFIKYAFKTIRKFNGIPIVVTQELDDLISSEIIKDAIINNADIKILMDMRKFIHKFDRLQNTLGLSEKAKTILLSVNKDNRDIFIDLGGLETKVFKNEMSPHEYLAYTTDGKERVKVQEYAERYGGMEKGIERLVEEQFYRA